MIWHERPYTVSLDICWKTPFHLVRNHLIIAKFDTIERLVRKEFRFRANYILDQCVDFLDFLAVQF